MKQILVFGMIFGMMYMVISCGPTVTNVDPATTLDTIYTGSVTTNGGTRLYQLSLSCGCPFKMRIDSADTTAITYSSADFADTTNPHLFTAAARAGLASGTHTGYLALHMAPPSLDTLSVILRDTVVIP